MRSVFKVRNGRIFQTLLTKIANDGNVIMMFNDNLYRQKGKTPEYLADLVRDRQFKLALIVAFNWEESNEGLLFWSGIAKELEND